MNYLERLNAQQKEGVLTALGPVLVIAGAGSGKTSMLTARMTHLILEHGILPQNILAVTFTNKAAGEMRERLQRALSTEQIAVLPHIGTFHSICTKILRREIERTGYTNQFVIYDDHDQLQLIKEAFAHFNLSDKMYSPKSFQYAINQAKCSAFSPQDVLNQSSLGAHNPYTKNLVQVYDWYQQQLFKNNAIDFGEIITLAYRLLRDNPDVLAKYQDFFRFIHVDEYQDTNRAQYLLIHLLAAKHQNLCVVGDEDQSIYKWRGADIRNILDFEKDYPQAKVIKLEQNYRSTQTIIEASSQLISHNASRKPKHLWTENKKGEKIVRYQLADERAEAQAVVQHIQKYCQTEGYAFKDCAIFYRTNAQSRVFEEWLNREKIPYRVVGGLRFYDRKEIKDVLAYMKVFANPSDSVSFKRIINVPARSIGQSTVEKIENIAILKQISFIDALRFAVSSPDVLSSGPRKKVIEFLSLFETLQVLIAQKTLSEFYHELLDRTQYVLELRKENTEESQSRIENLQELNTMLIEFEANFISAANEQSMVSAAESLHAFLESASLMGEEAINANSVESSQTGSISLMTLHTSKGLEFPIVFMVGMEEGLFPSIRQRDFNSDEDLEEERRLCYVGMTRAQQKLFMTHAVCRRIYGNILYQEPARFFLEIPENTVEFIDMSRSRWGSGTAASSWGRSATTAEPLYAPAGSASRRAGFSEYAVGSKVRHETYGLGVVRGFEGHNVEDSKITIEFSNRLTKKFILKYVHLETVNF